MVGRLGLKFAGLLAISVMLAPGAAHAAKCGNNSGGFENWKKEFQQEAANAGVKRRGLQALAGARYATATIKVDRAVRKAFRGDVNSFMKRRGGDLFWCRVRGQSLTPDDPFAHAVWSFADLSGVRPITHLSRRERQVAMHLTEGLTSKEIARLLDISPRTVEAHRAKLIEKLEARNGAELIARLTGTPL